jgi:hypothetical protein
MPCGAAALWERHDHRYQITVEATLQRGTVVFFCFDLSHFPFVHAAELFILEARKRREHDLETALSQPFKGLEPLRGMGKLWETLGGIDRAYIYSRD